jgi:hypothetical protein
MNGIFSNVYRIEIPVEKRKSIINVDRWQF